MSDESNNGLFELRSAYDLFKKCQHELDLFERESNHYNLFNLVVTLAHLRDWIWPQGHKNYHQASGENKAAASLHLELHTDRNYCVVRELSNSSKHFTSSVEPAGRKVVRGARAGLFRAGDSLSQPYYLVMNQDVRNSVYSVMGRYMEFFRAEGYET